MKKAGLSLVALLLLCLRLTTAYADGGSGLDAGFSVEDNIPPAKVTDLAVTSRSSTSLTLTWTAPGDDGLVGTASQYDIRYSTSSIDTEASWDVATVVSAPPTPQAPGSTETFTVTGISPGTRYYFALKTADEVPNWSDLSNSPLGITSSAPSGGGSPVEGELTGQTSLWGKINSSGVITENVTAESFDELLTLTIDKGTTALTRYSVPLKWIGMYQAKVSPSPPEAAYILSLTYDFQPAGATFDPPATLTYSYDRGHIPEDIDEEDLVIAGYDSSIDEWANLDCVVDTEAELITTKVSHFCLLAVFAYEIKLPPAIFEYSALNISPCPVNSGEVVTISILVANIGGEPGQCRVTLKINGKVEATKNVTLAAGTSKPISFNTIKNTPGTYSVAVDGLIGSFMVKEKPEPSIVPAEPMEPVPTPAKPANWPLSVPAEPMEPVPTPAKPTNWPLLGGVIGGAVVIGLSIFFLVRKRAR